MQHRAMWCMIEACGELQVCFKVTRTVRRAYIFGLDYVYTDVSVSIRCMCTAWYARCALRLRDAVIFNYLGDASMLYDAFLWYFVQSRDGDAVQKPGGENTSTGSVSQHAKADSQCVTAHETNLPFNRQRNCGCVQNRLFSVVHDK